MSDYDLIAAALPAYDIGEELGRGAFGIVVAGRHRRLGRDVAIKQLSPEFGSQPEVRRRFLDEGRLLARLDHPHVVPIYDFVEHGDVLLLVMERLAGGSVRDRLRDGAMNSQVACAFILAACAGLHHAHGKGVLHRDVKPENLMISSERILKVVDFGIAKVVGDSATVRTQAGAVIGTPAYISPEQARSLEVTPATDVYATGTVLYEALSGELPYSSGDGLFSLYQHVYEPPRPLGVVAPEVPIQLAAAVEKAIQPDPVDRYSSAGQLGQAVALAATAAWGPRWLETAGVPVLAAAPIVAAAGIDEKAAGPSLADGAAFDVREKRPRNPRKRVRASALMGAAAFGVGGGLAVVILMGGRSDERQAAPPSTTVVVAPAATFLPVSPPSISIPPGEAGRSTKVALGRDLGPTRSESCRDPRVGAGAEWQVGPIQVAGKLYDTVYHCNLFSGGVGALEFAIGGSFGELEVVIGFADKLSSANALAKFEFIGDERENLVDAQVLEFGESQTLRLDVTRVTRLKIVVTEIGTGGNASPSVPVLAGPVLISR